MKVEAESYPLIVKFSDFAVWDLEMFQSCWFFFSFLKQRQTEAVIQSRPAGWSHTCASLGEFYLCYKSEWTLVAQRKVLVTGMPVSQM